MTKLECNSTDTAQLERDASFGRFDNHVDDQAVSKSDLIRRPIPMWKRAFDIVGSLILIGMLSPVLAIVAIFIRVVSGESPIYQQNRLGEMGEYFTIYKFRTIATSHNAENHRQYVTDLKGTDTAMEKPDFGDSIIKGGTFLRSHAIDELPQLFNVLFGSMSLVGPRPDVLHWDDYEPGQRRRFEVAPGMTGLWQVSGKNTLSFTEMVDLDLKYIRERSVWLDLCILARTVWVVLDSGE